MTWVPSGSPEDAKPWQTSSGSSSGQNHGSGNTATDTQQPSTAITTGASSDTASAPAIDVSAVVTVPSNQPMPGSKDADKDVATASTSADSSVASSVKRPKIKQIDPIIIEDSPPSTPASTSNPTDNNSVQKQPETVDDGAAKQPIVIMPIPSMSKDDDPNTGGAVGGLSVPDTPSSTKQKSTQDKSYGNRQNIPTLRSEMSIPTQIHSRNVSASQQQLMFGSGA